MTLRPRTLKRAVLACALAAPLSLLAVPSGAGSSASLSLSASTNLGSGQRVTATWAGFPPSTNHRRQAVLLSECIANPTSVAHDCTPGILGRSDATGAGTSFVTISTGAITAGDGSQFTCGSGTDCSVVAYVDTTSPLSGAGAQISATTSIGFAPSASDCPLNTARVQGVGAEGVFRAMNAWSTRLCQAPSSLDVGYSLSDSADGKKAFIDQTVIPRPDFTATSIPFSTEERAALQKEGQGYRYSPVSLSGTVLAFRAFDRLTGQPLTHLTLTPSQIAHIFNGTRYAMPVAGSDPESQDILDLNPGTAFYGNLLPLGRLDASASTVDLTRFLLANASAAWQETPPWVAGRVGRDGTSPLQQDYTHPTDYLPDGLQQQGVSGLLLDGADALGIALSGNGSFGASPTTVMLSYMDASTAQYYGLPTVCIQMDPSWRSSGRPCVSATPDAFRAGIAAATPYTDGTYVTNVAPSDPAAWPMTSVGYLVTPTGLKDTARAASLRSMLTYAASDGQGASVLPPSYAPITPAMTLAVAQAADVIDKAVPFPAEPTVISATPASTPTFTPSSSFNPSLSQPLAASSLPASTSQAHDVPKASPIHYAAAGATLSSHHSPWLLLALALFVGAGLLLAPRTLSRRSEVAEVAEVADAEGEPQP